MGGANRLAVWVINLDSIQIMKYVYSCLPWRIGNYEIIALKSSFIGKVVVAICVRRKLKEGNRFKAWHYLGELALGKVRGPFGVGLWKHIISGWDSFL